MGPCVVLGETAGRTGAAAEASGSIDSPTGMSAGSSALPETRSEKGRPARRGRGEASVPRWLTRPGGSGRSLGGLRGDELRGNTLIVGGFLAGGFLADLLGGLVLLVGDDDGRDHVAGLVNGSLDDGHLVGRAAAEEEGSQLHGSLLREDAADDLGRVRHAGVAQDVAQGSGGTGLGVPGTEDDAINARGENRACTHRAGLEGDDERAARQAPGTPGAAGLTQGDDFSVT